MSKIYLEILDANRKRAYKQLGRFSSHGYLAGGTALALQLGHRTSIDFDIFVSRKIGRTLRRHTREVFGEVKYHIDAGGDQISFEIDHAVQVTFLWYYYPLLYPVIATRSLPLASIRDIAADKAHAIGRRVVWRDYIDIFWLLRHDHMTLGQIIEDAKKKFKGEFNEILFLEQLTYFEGLIIEPVEYRKKAYKTAEIMDFFKTHVARYRNTLLQEQ